MNFDWLEHLITSLIGGGIVGGVVAMMKLRADNRAQHATAEKTENEAGSEIVDQARAVVQMWQEIGKQLQSKITDLETRMVCLEASEKAKTIRIGELETTNTLKDIRIRELERDVERLQGEVFALKQAQGI